MEQANDAIGMLDLLVRPGFCVQDRKILRANQPAECCQIPIGTDVTELMLTGKEEYLDFHSGCLYLTLELAGKPWGASVTRIGQLDIFVLDQEQRQSELQAMALAARELREPLSNIMTTADRLFPQSVQHDPEIAQQVARLNRGLFQILRIIGNMSDAGRCPGCSHPETRDITGFLAEVLEKAQNLVQEAGLQLRYTGPKEPILCLMDGEILERAVLNILSNAVKFTPAGGTIDAKLQRRGQMLYLTIQDTGCGIPANLRGNVYNRYLRQPAIEDSRYGIGLGMVIVRSAAALHGGTVLVDQPADCGTRVTVSLAIRQCRETAVRSPILKVDYAGGRDRGLIELSDCLPLPLYDTKKIN